MYFTAEPLLSVMHVLSLPTFGPLVLITQQRGTLSSDSSPADIFLYTVERSQQINYNAVFAYLLCSTAFKESTATYAKFVEYRRSADQQSRAPLGERLGDSSSPDRG